MRREWGESREGVGEMGESGERVGSDLEESEERVERE